MLKGVGSISLKPYLRRLEKMQDEIDDIHADFEGWLKKAAGQLPYLENPAKEATRFLIDAYWGIGDAMGEIQNMAGEADRRLKKR